MLSEALAAIVQQIRELEYGVGGSAVVALVFLILAGLARASALADFRIYDRIWQPVAPNFAAAPSPSDGVINGLRAFVRGSVRTVLMVAFGFLAFDFFFVGGDLTLTLLAWFGI